jgi:D-erythronate 2-dehydrogenase
MLEGQYMHILVIGAGGMLGTKLVQALTKANVIGGKSISKITRHDAVLCPPPPASDCPIETLMGDISLPDEAASLLNNKPDLIFHLAAVVSGEAETNFEKGYSINLEGTRHMLEAIRQIGDGYCPRLIFTSSIAVFGAPFPEAIDDEFLTAPLTSYGTQKAICELLISDYSRRGILQGLSLRMPTVCVRPGKPNKAASGFFSNIIREPLVGQEAILPVSEQVRHWHASPRAAVAMLLHGAEIDLADVGPRRALAMPGISCTVAQQISALGRIAGDKAVRLIKNVPDETISRIVAGWPSRFTAERALRLGFMPDADFESIVRVHIEDELQGVI